MAIPEPNLEPLLYDIRCEKRPQNHLQSQRRSKPPPMHEDLWGPSWARSCSARWSRQGRHRRMHRWERRPSERRIANLLISPTGKRETRVRESCRFGGSCPRKTWPHKNPVSSVTDNRETITHLEQYPRHPNQSSESPPIFLESRGLSVNMSRLLHSALCMILRPGWRAKYGV